MRKLTYEFVKEQFEKEGYELLSKEYINAHQKLDYICPNGHKHSMSWNCWQRGVRCSICAGLAKKTIEFIRSEFEKRGCQLLTKRYINCEQKLEYICKNGHRHNISWDDFRAGRGCPYCVGKISKGEIKVKNFIESLGIDVSANDRNQIFNPNTGNGFELDIFIPILNKAIEYNGEYWHQDKDRDLLKQELCELKGIDLLTIWDKEWKAQNHICKSKIMDFVFN